MLKDAALATLDIMSRSFEKGMILKDASAYNIQFFHGKPILIDTLSFTHYYEDQPWIAYGQFCMHFLAPLALMSKADIALSSLLLANLDGIPLNLTAQLLPINSRLNWGLLLHIFSHSLSLAKFKCQKSKRQMQNGGRFSRNAMLALVDSLRTTIQKLSWRIPQTEWSEYYDNTNYSNEAFSEKIELVGKYLAYSSNEIVIDFGANDGTFSRISSRTGRFTISCDIDPAAVEKNYLQIKKTGEQNILPLILNLMNPTPALGWMNRERKSLSERLSKNSTVLALALIHHLAITGNIPLEQILEYLSQFGKKLIIEYIPKSDSKVQRMLKSREDIFPEYTFEKFSELLNRKYTVLEKRQLGNSERLLILGERKK
jgi:hypothetical protein